MIQALISLAVMYKVSGRSGGGDRRLRWMDKKED